MDPDIRLSVAQHSRSGPGVPMHNHGAPRRRNNHSLYPRKARCRLKGRLQGSGQSFGGEGSRYNSAPLLSRLGATALLMGLCLLWNIPCGASGDFRADSRVQRIELELYEQQIG
jgi:hypothetical protein